jgi:hypothetical protein
MLTDSYLQSVNPTCMESNEGQTLVQVGTELGYSVDRGKKNFVAFFTGNCVVYWTVLCTHTVHFQITRDGPSTSGDAIVDCTHVPGPPNNTCSLLLWYRREVVWHGEHMRGNLRPHHAM